MLTVPYGKFKFETISCNLCQKRIFHCISSFLFCLKDFTSCKNHLACQSSSQTKEVPFIHNECAKNFSGKDDTVQQRDTLQVQQRIINNSCQKKSSFKDQQPHNSNFTGRKPFVCGRGKAHCGKNGVLEHSQLDIRGQIFFCNECRKGLAQKIALKGTFVHIGKSSHLILVTMRSLLIDLMQNYALIDRQESDHFLAVIVKKHSPENLIL